MSDDLIEAIGTNVASTRSIDPKAMTFEETKSIYTFAKNLYEAGHYDKAEPLFRTIATFCPMEYAYWFGLASSLQMQAKYEEALSMWSTAAAINGAKIATPYLHAAECFLSLRQKEETIHTLHLAQTKIATPAELSKIEGMLALTEGETA